MRVLMIMIMLVIVHIRYFGLLLRSLICVCHLSRGQIHAFQETSGSAAPRHALGARLRLITTVRGFDREGQTTRTLPTIVPSGNRRSIAADALHPFRLN